MLGCDDIRDGTGWAMLELDAIGKIWTGMAAWGGVGCEGCEVEGVADCAWLATGGGVSCEQPAGDGGVVCVESRGEGTVGGEVRVAREGMGCEEPAGDGRVGGAEPAGHA